MFSPRFHRYIYLTGLLALALGMMLGTVPTSIPQLLLAGNWLLAGNYRQKWKRIRGNWLFWTLSSIYVIHLAGVLYSSDFDAALHDIRTKMPLAFLPLVLLSEEPINRQELKYLLCAFLLGTAINLTWCHIYSFVLHKNEVVRNASRYMSHIRLGLYVNVAIAVSMYLARQSAKPKMKLLLYLMAAYCMISLFALGLASGLIAFVLMAVATSVYFITQGKTKWRFSILFVLLLPLAALAFYVYKVGKEQLAVKDVPQNKKQLLSPNGNLYAHLDTTGQKENGYYVFMNVQITEVMRVWNREFPGDSFSFEPPHNVGRYEVLLRYMTSRGMLKDSASYMQLTDVDKKNIRENYTNYLQPGWSFLKKRTYELVNEYDEFVRGSHVNGHSFTMRLYFWKAALYAISKKPVFGYGTGDVQVTMNKAYEDTDSPLDKKWQLRPHNQFLTITVALGIVGLLIFMLALTVPAVRLSAQLHLLYWPFLFLAIVSFFFEDTLETQAGLTFVAFFNSVFLAEAWFRKQEIPGDSQENH